MQDKEKDSIDLLLFQLGNSKAKGDSAECLLIASQILDLDPENPTFRLELAQVFWQLGLLNLAKEQLEKCYELAPVAESILKLIRQIDSSWKPRKGAESAKSSEVVASTELDISDL